MRALYVNNIGNNSNANGNNNLNNNARFLRITRAQCPNQMLYDKIISYDNLYLAYRKARKRKTLKPYVVAFEENLKENILTLHYELLTETYSPRPLKTFILRDPKTRKISKSDFRDRIVHHAVCNIIEPIFDKAFIYDSYANRIGKGTHKAIKRFEYFKRKITKNCTRSAFVLKADIKHYFETVDHKILLNILKKKILDEKTLRLIKIILDNHQTKISSKGMPLGNLASQFFANVYLNELDQYVKHKLRVKHYIRYVDDFIITDADKEKLEIYKKQINTFLDEKLALELNPDKSKIYAINKGVPFLGLRIYSYHRLLCRRNIRKFKEKLIELMVRYDNKNIDYDIIYNVIEGWTAYSNTANSYNLRKRLFGHSYNKFVNEISTKEYNRYLQSVNTFNYQSIRNS